MTDPTHILNWYAGWSSIILAFVTGAIIGLGFHKPEFLGGYDSLRRRMVRLGHIALAALGLFNVVYSLSPWPEMGTLAERIATPAWVAGCFLMPTVCFLTAWREKFRHLFALPVVSLLVAVIATVAGGR
jgi:hypothetical protein